MQMQRSAVLEILNIYLKLHRAMQLQKLCRHGNDNGGNLSQLHKDRGHEEKKDGCKEMMGHPL